MAYPDPAALPKDTVIETERLLAAADTEEGITAWAEMFAADLVMGDFWGATDLLQGRDVVVAWFKEMKSALPDMSVEITRLTCDGYTVAEEGACVGTHTGEGELLGYATTGKRVSWPFISMKEISPETGQIVTDYTMYMESAHVIAQLTAE
jgi:predicted ester cyclase